MAPEIQLFLWFSVGAMCLLRGNILRNKHENLARCGQKTTGIVTSVIDNSWLKLFDDQGLFHYSIRFVTADQRWISKSFTTFVDKFDSRYREGESIDIVYNQTNPEEFTVGSYANSYSPIVLMLGGLGCIGYSFWLAYLLP
ncbi:DUF3592 domain-containing protein [Hymenobacter aquaticus]|uniref:DUF3592 domain-containing protein n=1 Tax=Hymenobacter aquaticus TaxID=1867101 RepID=A0A4Z0Q361_9BACT|nr:DUF3592 domain-containing protein [Hymenobacter aquaticus]TGE23919.1 DUF3592 domain-containing protein [Hymenobacter aquaticus]